MNKILGRYSISAKMVFAMALLGSVGILIAGVGAQGFEQLRQAVADGRVVTHEVRVAMRVSALVAQLGRDEFALAADPAGIAEVAKTVADRRKRMRDSLDDIRKTADAGQAELLDAVEAALRDYEARLDATLAAAAAAQGSGTPQAAGSVLAAVRAGQDAGTRLRQAVGKYVTFAEERGNLVTAEAEATARSKSWALLGIALAGIGLGLTLGLVIGRRGIVGPIRAIAASLRHLADGDLATEVPGVGRRDEVGEIAGTAQVFRDKLVRTRDLEEAARQAELRAAEDRRTAMRSLADQFEASVQGVVQSVSAAAQQLQQSARSMSAVADQTNRQAAVVAAATEETSASVQTAAAASEELGSSIQEISRQIVESSRIAEAAVAEAARGNASVSGLSESAERIGAVVQLIQNIASQTNLLALNATIEAARAGESGKGFAVVASEVKALANQTAKATEEIAQQISEIQSRTTSAVGAMQAVGGTIGRVNEISASIAAAMEEQTAATQEIGRNVAHAAQGAQEVTSNIAGVSQVASEAGGAAGQVLSAAGTLSDEADRLRREVDAFIARVRAA